MRLLAYRSVPLSVPCVVWKFEVRECLGLKIGGRGTAFPCVLWHFNHCFQHSQCKSPSSSPCHTQFGSCNKAVKSTSAMSCCYWSRNSCHTGYNACSTLGRFVLVLVLTVWYSATHIHLVSTANKCHVTFTANIPLARWPMGIGLVSMRQQEAIASSSCNCILVSSIKSSLYTAPKCFILRSDNKKIFWVVV